MQAIVQGKVIHVVDRTYPLSSPGKAVDQVSAGDAQRKVAITA